ncbi:MAG: Fibronectin type domain protein [Nitrosarchaeum sp.]|nr:Fibronectin type domain protein [Nitrosarchaeum sp.]
MDKKLFASLCFGALLLMGTISFQTADAELKFSLKFGTPGSSASNLQNPNNVLVSGSGNTIYVIDTGNHRINAFEIDGDHDFKFGSFCDVDSIVACNTTSPGADNSGDGQFNNPKAAVLDSSNNLLYVADTANDRIQVINVDNEGAFDYRFGSSGSADGKLNSPEGVALDKSEDLLYVADTGNNRIQVFDIDNVGDFSLTRI